MAAFKHVTKGPSTQKVRRWNGKIVKPCLYYGVEIRHGKYFAAWVDEAFVFDDNGRPIEYQQLGKLENA